MEEKVYSRAVTKQAMSHRVADKKQVDRNYSMADLEALYHFERVDMAARPNAAPAEDELLSNLLWSKHKLIYRYHMHETMLDNKTEQDLTEAEKKVAWAQFKSKNNLSSGAVAGLGLGILGGGLDAAGLAPTDSQLSDPDLDSQVLTELDLACAPNYDDDAKPELPALPPLALPIRQMAPPTPTPAGNNNPTIFGDDPYNTSYGGGLSIIEEQRQRLSLKPELGMKRTVSQVTVSAAEVELLRELEENAVPGKVKGEDEHYEPPAKKKVTTQEDVPVMETIDLLNLSYEGDSEEPIEESREEQSTEMEVSIPPSVPALKSDSCLSMIEYDPVGSTQELASYAETTSDTTDPIVPPPPASYEKFKASLVEDPSVTTSTTTASPASVVVVATCSSPAAVPASRVIMTRSMKRAAVPLQAGDVPAIKAVKKIRGIDDGGSLLSVSCEENRCRALVPFTGPRFAMNPALKALLGSALSRADLGNSCRALVPYVPRVSLLEDILAAAFSEQLSFTKSDSEDDGSSSTSDSYPIGLLTQTSTLSWTAADLASLDEHISEYYTALSDLEDEMDFTQQTLTDSQRAADELARDEKEHAELMVSLHETRQVVTGDILQERCLAVVPYNPPVSLLAVEEEQDEREVQHEPKAVVFHASLAEALTNSSARGLKRKSEKELPVSADNVVWKKPRTSKVYRAKRRSIDAAVISIPTAIEFPVEEPESVTAKLVTSNTTLSWGDEEVDFVDWNISCGEIEQREKERQLAEPESSALVPYKPAPSKKVQQPRLVVMYGPIRSFWDPKLLSSSLLPLVNERKGQILKAQHNKLFRFAPYDKRDRKWRKVEKVVVKEEEEANTCRSLVLYTGSFPQPPLELTVRFLLHPLLVGYLSFCRYATQHSTMRETQAAVNRGTKRKVEWESGGNSMKRSRAVNSAP